MPAPSDWTSAWGAAGLALSAWTRDARLLRAPRAARLLELTLELEVLRHALALHAYVVLPGALHVVAGSLGPAATIAWPAALGRVKGAFARRWNRAAGGAGPVWSDRARVAPLTTVADVRDAVRRCHGAPVAAGLTTRPDEHPASSWHALHGWPRRDFVAPVPGADAPARYRPR